MSRGLLMIKFTINVRKILGGDIEGAISLIKKVKTKQTIYNGDNLEKDFKTRFVTTYYTNQTLIDIHCTTDSNGNTKCISRVSAFDPSHQPPHHEYMLPSTKNLLKFSISNGEVHYVNEIITMFPQCSISKTESGGQSKLSTSNDSSVSSESHDKLSYEYTTDETP